MREDVPAKTVFSEYGGELITLDEARKRQMEVIALFFSPADSAAVDVRSKVDR